MTTDTPTAVIAEILEQLPEGDSLVEDARLNELLSSVSEELEQLQPAIEEIENVVARLDDLKRRKQRLIAFKLSLEALMRPEQTVAPVRMGMKSASMGSVPHSAKTDSVFDANALRLKAFYPDQALEATEMLLPRKESINYHLFKAIVMNGGKATTEDIRNYLVNEGITSPTTGLGFENVGLSQISSRVNYLMRKNIVSSLGGGEFVSNYGWGDSV